MNKQRTHPVITRDNLVTRWARITGTTFPAAWDATNHIDDDVLRDSVERAEDMIRDVEDAHDVEHGAFADWVKGDTTSVQGQTR